MDTVSPKGKRNSASARGSGGHSGRISVTLESPVTSLHNSVNCWPKYATCDAARQEGYSQPCCLDADYAIIGRVSRPEFTHAARYAFAARLARGKRVLDAGGAAGAEQIAKAAR